MIRTSSIQNIVTEVFRFPPGEFLWWKFKLWKWSFYWVSKNCWVTLYFKSLLHPRFTAVFFKSFSDLLLFFSLKIDNFMFSLYVLAQTQELRREIGRMLMKITIPSDVLFNHGKFSFFIIFIVQQTNSLTYNY